MSMSSCLESLFPSFQASTLCPDIRQAHHPPGPHGCELLFRRRCLPPPRRALHRPRRHFLPRVTPRRSPSPRLQGETSPANLLTARPNAIPDLAARTPAHPRALLSSGSSLFYPGLSFSPPPSGQISFLPIS